MKRAITLLLLVWVALLYGCAAAGSAAGVAGLNGTVSPPPQDELNITAKLDKHYGLGGLDEYFGEPEDYGHRDTISIMPVSRDGRFASADTDIGYHIAFFLLPPIGAYPKKPPKPYYYLQFSDLKNELYLVGESEKGVDYRVFDTSSRAELPKERARWRVKSGRYSEMESEGRPGWRLNLEIEKM